MASINLTWTASILAPVNGYRIKYWPTASPLSVSTVAPNPTGTTHSIINLAAGTSYSGTIEASCSGGTYSTPVNWSVTASTSGGGGTGGGGGTTTPVCYSYIVACNDETANRNSYQFSYISCAGDATTRSILNDAIITICAQENTLTTQSSFIESTQSTVCG